MRLVPALLFAAAVPAMAQTPTNAAVLGRLADACVAEAGAMPALVRLRVDAPYLRSAVVTGLAARGTQSVVADTAAGRARLALVPEALSVVYARSGRGRLQRTVTLRARLALDDAAGVRTLDRPCQQQAVDVVAARDRARLEDSALPETVGARPGRSAWSSAVQTGLAAGAVVVSTLLLFNLRSR
ncbi:MAG: hypothetical protein LCH53_05920 [Bacteroidetes bacterium]|nr:hypothetical protein [Bacteroidota bacterium]